MNPGLINAGISIHSPYHDDMLRSWGRTNVSGEGGAKFSNPIALPDRKENKKGHDVSPS